MRVINLFSSNINFSERRKFLKKVVAQLSLNCPLLPSAQNNLAGKRPIVQKFLATSPETENESSARQIDSTRLGSRRVESSRVRSFEKCVESSRVQSGLLSSRVESSLSRRTRLFKDFFIILSFVSQY